VTLYQEKTNDNKSSTVSDQKNIQKNIVMKCSGVFSTIQTYNAIREMLDSINSKLKKLHKVTSRTNFSLYYYFEAQLQTQPTSCCHPQVKLSGRGLAGLSPAHQWV
jgi:hypothetical protein